MAIAYTENIMNATLTDEILSSLGEGSITNQVSNDEGNIVYSYLDTYKTNLLRTKVSQTISTSIKQINQQDDFENIMIPLGYLFSRNYFLSNGIRVPINLEVVGNHKVDIEARVLEYGINSSVIEIYLAVTLDVLVVIPFQKEVISSVCKVPLSLEIINSSVPKFYFGGTSGIPTLILGQ